MIQRRTKMKKSIDKKIFSRTAKKTAKITMQNIENLRSLDMGFIIFIKPLKSRIFMHLKWILPLLNFGKYCKLS